MTFGFQWECDRTKQNYVMLHKVVEFCEINHKLPSQRGPKNIEKQLANWVQVRITQKRKGKLNIGL